MVDASHVSGVEASRAPSSRQIARFKTLYMHAASEVAAMIAPLDLAYQALRLDIAPYRKSLPLRPASDGLPRQEETAYAWCVDYIGNRVYGTWNYVLRAVHDHHPQKVHHALDSLANITYDPGYREQLIGDLKQLKYLSIDPEQLARIESDAAQLEARFTELQQKARDVANAMRAELNRHFPARQIQ